MTRLSTKQRKILAYFADTSEPRSTADVHRVLGQFYAYGHHRFTYATVSRLMRRGLLARAGGRTPSGGVALVTTSAGLTEIREGVLA